MIRSAVLLCSLVATFQASTNAESIWTKIQTDHFCLYVHGDQLHAARTLSLLETARRFFLGSTWGHATPDSQIRIVAFDSAAEYQDYAPNSLSFAHFISRTGRTDYMVVTNLEQQQDAAIHEYVHVVFSHVAFGLPDWINEGLAEAYSSIEMENGIVAFGASRPQFLEFVKTLTPEMLRPVLTVKDGRFPQDDLHTLWQYYEVGWAAIRMMLIEDRYASRFPEFLAQAQSHALDENLRSLYGKTLDQFTRDIVEFIHDARTDVMSARQNVLPPNIRYDGPVGDTELQSVLAQNVRTGTPTESDIKQKLRALAALNPNDPRPEAGLGFLAVNDEDPVEAQTHFRAAIAKGSSDSEMMISLSFIEEKLGTPDIDVLRILQRVMELNPTDETRLRTGWAAIRAGKYSLAAETLKRVRSIPAWREFDVPYEIAYCSAKSNDFHAALAWGMQAQQKAQTEEDTQRVRNLLRSTERHLQKSVLPPANIRNANGSSQNDNIAMAF